MLTSQTRRYPDKFVLRVKLEAAAAPMTVGLVEVDFALVRQTRMTVGRTGVHVFRERICRSHNTRQLCHMKGKTRCCSQY